jgi:sn-glycerol 3-phosphate transport system substrate-binding protein
MMKRLLMLFFCFLCYQCVVAKPLANKLCAGKTIITFWHSLAGSIEMAVNDMVQDFNLSQSEYCIKPIYKGGYLETLSSYASAFSAGQAPDLVQIFEVGTQAMLYPSGIVKPVGELLLENHLTIAENDFFPRLKGLYSKQGQLMGMPFNVSIPVIYSNKALLNTLNISSFSPVDWNAFEKYLQSIHQTGLQCPFTSAYPSWTLVESYLALHGLSNPPSKEANQALFKHFTRLKKLQNQQLFRYSGRTDEATLLFTRGNCALFAQSSGAYKSLSQAVGFPLGINAIPLDYKLSNIRQNNVIGGGAIWVSASLSSHINRGAALFLAFWTTPSTQKKWFQTTGYLPLGLKGRYQILDDRKNPILRLAKQDLQAEGDWKPILIGVRIVFEETMEAIFAGMYPVKNAIEKISSRAAYAHLRFKHNTASA